MLRLLACLALLASAPSAWGQERIVIPLAADTLLYVENRGATRILFDLNETPFKLVTDRSEIDRSRNAFYIPRDSALTLDIAAYMTPLDNDNVIEITVQGPAGTDAEIFIANTFVAGQRVAYVLQDLDPIPGTFNVRAAPNPSVGPVTIHYDVPEDRTTGVSIRLEVLDARGRRVATLVDDVRFPGSFSAAWDGAAAAGLYIVRLETPFERETLTITRAR